MSNQQGTKANIENQVNVGRKYKSRKERLCDACRKRKVCCTRDVYEKIAHCAKREETVAKHILSPNVRRNRQPSTRPRASTSSASSSISIPPHPVQSLISRKPSKAAPSEWICQFVRFSGDQDPFVLRHCSFSHLNCYKAPDWAVLRIKGDHDAPLHFTVLPDGHLDARPDYYPTADTEAIVAPHSDELLRTYFDVVHPSYPLLDPSRFNYKPRMAILFWLLCPT